jgi:pimeloyl-ACP methyl ester carboxylesterase
MATDNRRRRRRDAISLICLLCLSISNGFTFQSTSTGHSTHPISTSILSAAVARNHETTKSINAESSSRITSFWKWRDHDIFTEVRTVTTKNSVDGVEKPSVILLHGFGASTTYWRETMLVLQDGGYEVHSLDFLGQGRSSKPFVTEGDGRISMKSIWKNGDGKVVDPNENQYDIQSMGKNSHTSVEYSINLWANMVDDYARHHQLNDVVLMGNSLGSLVALSVATGDFVHSTTLDNQRDTQLFGYLAGNTDRDEQEARRVKGICLFNCAVGLNSRNVIKNPCFSPLQRSLFNLLFDVLNKLIFDNKLLLRYALDQIVTKQLLEDALRSLYICSPDRVDIELVDSFYYPAKLGGEGAVEAIRQIYTNDAGLTPMEYHEKYEHILKSLPLHLIWGSEDAVTPINGDVGLFYCDRVANNRGGNGRTTIDIVKSGHVPFDDNPLDTHAAMMRWLDNSVMR